VEYRIEFQRKIFRKIRGDPGKNPLAESATIGHLSLDGRTSPELFGQPVGGKSRLWSKKNYPNKVLQCGNKQSRIPGFRNGRATRNYYSGIVDGNVYISRIAGYRGFFF